METTLTPKEKCAQIRTKCAEDRPRWLRLGNERPQRAAIEALLEFTALVRTTRITDKKTEAVAGYLIWEMSAELLLNGLLLVCIRGHHVPGFEGAHFGESAACEEGDVHAVFACGVDAAHDGLAFVGKDFGDGLVDEYLQLE